MRKEHEHILATEDTEKKRVGHGFTQINTDYFKTMKILKDMNHDFSIVDWIV